MYIAAAFCLLAAGVGWGVALDSAASDPFLMYGAARSADPEGDMQVLGQRDTSVRDVEQLQQNSLWGHKYVAGGAGEGKQFLKPSGIIPNRVEVKTDAILPAYCEPPNPCPPGMNAEDGCAEEFENTADFSRDYQNKQQCMCDEEHMFSCPQNQRKLTADQENSQATFADVLEQFLEKQNIVDQHKGVRAKKFREDKRTISKRSVHQQQHKYNPYLAGDKLVNIRAKKG